MPRTNIPAPKGRARQQEIVKCGVDPLYFLKRYGFITHPTKGLVKFSTYPFQDECVKDFENHRFNIVLKSRQLGLSTICAGYCLWLALFQKEKNIVVLATKLEVAKTFFSKVAKMYDNLPDWLVLPKELTRSVKGITFSNGSKITAIPTGDDAGRGEGVSLLIVDEAAHIQGFDDLWMGLYSTVSTGGRIVLLSTPKGVGNVFHRTWMGCDLEKKENDFHGIRLPWDVHPDHDQDWFDEQCRNLNPRGIQQELLCSFLGSGHTYLHELSLEYIDGLIRPPKEKLGKDYATWIWEYPKLENKYLITADVARGDSDDYSTAHVLDTTNGEVVAEYQGKIPPDRFAELLIDLGNKYCFATICPENNSFGLVAAYRLRDLEYPNIYYEKLSRQGIFQTYSAEEVADLQPGIATTVKNRQAILLKLEEAIRNKRIKIYSSRFAEEAKTFIWNTNVNANGVGGKAQAIKGYNDDLIMSLAISCYLYESQETPVDNTALNAAMLAAWGRNVTNMNTGATSAIQEGVQRTFQDMSNGNHYPKPLSKGDIRPGVNHAQIRQSVDRYNAYSWLFDEQAPKGKK